jgi:hypothetical protein
MLGPGGGALCWLLAERKDSARAAILAQPQRAISLAISLYNSRVALVLGYVAQLICVPDSLL